MTAPAPERTLTEGFALLLAEHGLGDYRPDTVGGEVFLGGMPPEPAAAVAVTLYPNTNAPDARHGYDDVQVLYRVRGAPGDLLGAERRAQALYDALHGLPRGTELSGTGARVQRFHATSSGPGYAGRDDQGRHELTVMFAVELRRRTPNRR